jgi:hypothetical protein
MSTLRYAWSQYVVIKREGKMAKTLLLTTRRVKQISYWLSVTTNLYLRHKLVMFTCMYITEALDCRGTLCQVYGCHGYQPLPLHGKERGIN